MCSISGFIDFNKQTSLETLQKINRSMIHRGPDGEGYLFYQLDNANLGFAHRRLSIIDLSEGGKQPMQYNFLDIVFNGEIYNYSEIRSVLVSKGHEFVTSSDTEVILHAFSEWGTNCVNFFIGMFAIVIFDKQKNKLFFLRDRAGVKPLFYYFNNNLLLFASELKAFHQHPAFEPNINLNAAGAFMQYGYVPTPHCIFDNCQKLEPGHVLEFSLSTQKFTKSSYWNVYDYYNKPKVKIDFQEAKLETEKILTSAFKYRLVSDVPVGMFLSGGYDSTCVTALLQKDSTQKIKTFTIGVGDKHLNEAPFAKKIAEYLQTDHTEYYCNEQDVLNFVDKIPYYFDEPFGDSSAIPTMLVSQMARKDVTVALSADAGDEIFAGYNRYDFVKHIELLKKLPTFSTKIVSMAMKKIHLQSILGKKANPLFAQRFDKIRAIIEDSSTQNLMKNVTNVFSNEELNGLFLQKPQAITTNFDEEIMPQYSSTLSQMMATDFKTYMLDDILQKVDRATMSVGLEGREPFLDHRIIEFVAQLPNNFKYHNGVKKYLLKEIVHQYVPKEMMERPKMGFAIPINKWLKSELKPLIEGVLSPKKIKEQNIFNSEVVANILNEYFSGKDQHILKVWHLLMFQLWHEKWIENQ